MSTCSRPKESKVKRKRVVLTLSQKLEVIQLLDKSVSYTTICDKYGIGRSTVGDIKKNREKILQFKKETEGMGMKREAKSMKLSNNVNLDKALYVWYSQKLCEKAKLLHQQLQLEQPFVASEGWKWRFCKRHGIRNLSLEGEKLSADQSAADDFVSTFSRFVEEQKLCLDQVFNCDETGLNFRLLPEKTLAASFEKSADGRKKSKDRVTLNLCSNASGSIKLKPHLIGKAKKPRCFKSIKIESLPVQYSAQKNAWMDTSLFIDWFHHNFIPYIRCKLKKLGLEPRAVLTLDNCSAHPDPELLVSTDGKITAKFLPPNVTSLIQPMDQGVIQAVKLKYKKKLLRKLLIEDDRGTSVVDFVKSVDMKQVAYLVAEAWQEITTSTLRKSWQKILPRTGLPRKDVLALTAAHSGGSVEVSAVLGQLFDEANSNDDLLTLKQVSTTSKPGSCFSHAYFRGIRVRTQTKEYPSSSHAETPESGGKPSVLAFQSLLNEAGFQLEEDEIYHWLESDLNDPGTQMLSDSEICDLVSEEKVTELDSEEDESEAQTAVISNSEAAFMFEQCLSWLKHQPEADAYNTTCLRQLLALAAEKRVNSFMQSKITSFFHSQHQSHT